VHLWKDLIAYRKLVQLLRQQQPDLVHTHSGKAGILGRLAARKAGVRGIIHHIHGPSFGLWQGAAANFIFTNAERRAGRVTDHFLCSAAAMSRLYVQAGIGQTADYTRVFSGFELAPFLNANSGHDLRAQLGFAPDDFVIAKISRLAPLKGHTDLVAAAPRILEHCPNARFLLVGDGVLRKKIETEMRAAGLSNRFVFTGLVAPDEVPRYLAAADCVAHLSYREAVSRVLPQSLAVGRPVVAYDFDGADEACVDGQTGFIVKTGDVTTVAARIVQLARQPELRRQMGQSGRAWVAEQFTVERMVETQYQVYRAVATRKGIR
jgi:glycosyltransferase involved in cell wall biosynthesis